MKILPLDKIVKQGVTYETPKRVGYKIVKLGTNSTTDAFLKVEQKPTGVVKTVVAPLRVLGTNKLGPVDLGDKFYVIPPETKFTWEGATGSKARLLGDCILLGPGEAFPTDLLGRYAVQHRDYLQHVEGTYSLGTDVTWKDGAEYEIYSLTPKTIERYTFDGILLADISGDTVSEGDFGIRFWLDGAPLETDVAEKMQKGIDILSCPRPPTATDGEIPFTLKHYPVEVLGDHTISIRVINTSGADKDPATGASWSVTITTLVKYFRAE